MNKIGLYDFNWSTLAKNVEIWSFEELLAKNSHQKTNNIVADISQEIRQLEDTYQIVCFDQVISNHKWTESNGSEVADWSGLSVLSPKMDLLISVSPIGEGFHHPFTVKAPKSKNISV